MNKNNIKSKYDNRNGFTIIEVVLVLAIAGLIFLTVFLAVPNMQKSQRDNARRQDVGKVIAGFQQYKVDYENQWPSNGYHYVTTDKYFSGLSHLTYVYVEPGSSSQMCSSHGGTIEGAVVAIGCKCSDGAVSPQPSARFAKVVVRLERNGNRVYCQDYVT